METMMPWCAEGRNMIFILHQVRIELARQTAAIAKHYALTVVSCPDHFEFAQVYIFRANPSLKL